jgi:hypothetical protein
MIAKSILAGRDTATPEFQRDQQKQIFTGKSPKCRQVSARISEKPVAAGRTAKTAFKMECRRR